MKLVTGNRLSDGRVIYLGEGDRAVEALGQAAVFDDMRLEAALATAASQRDLFVNPYAVEVTGRTPSGRDRLKETIRSAGPTVGNSLPDGARG